MALCTITGFVYMPNGQPAAQRLFKFKPSRKGIVADYFGAVVPEVIEATTNELGFLTVELLTENYVAFSALYNGPVTVPDAEEASLYEVFGGTGSVTPPAIAPNFTVLPSLLGSTSLGGTITVDLGTATGSPEPVMTGTLTRPGESPVAVTQGQLITVQAGDQGGSLSLTATATSSAGVDTETVSRAIPAVIPAPVFTTPLADVALTVGDDDVVVNLDDNTDNATSYSVSPSGGAVTISGSMMTTSAGDAVDQLYVVTATGPGGFATDSFGVLVEATPVSPVDAVVVIGASIMNNAFGKNLTTPHNTATNLLAAEGHNLPVYGWATGSTTLADADEHYLEARAAFPNALIVMHFGGNDVSSFRPYPGGLATIESRLAALLAVTQGDARFYPASLTFRDYDDTTFQNPNNGSRPYNENVLIPWIAANFPHAMANYGRPKLDFYRRVLVDFETWLSTDNVHLAGTGTTQFRAWLIARVADLLEDVTPPLIEERVYTAPPVDPDPEPEPEPGTYPLSVVNMAMDTSQIPYNNFQVETPVSVPSISIFDVEGVSTGITGQLTFTPPETTIGTTNPGRGRNSSGRVLGLSTYNKNLLCTEVVRDSLYVTTSVVGTITLTGCVPNAQYEIGVIGSREATSVRNTVLNINGTTLTWDTSETTVQVRTATVTATAGGVITMALSCGPSTSFAYLNGFSLRRVS